MEDTYLEVDDKSVSIGEQRITLTTALGMILLFFSLNGVHWIAKLSTQMQDIYARFQRRLPNTAFMTI